jgi:hypothetical protein
MQKKHTKGLFIDSSYRRTRALKALLHGVLHHQGDQASGETFDYSGKPSFTPGKKDARIDNHKDQMKKAASL